MIDKFIIGRLFLTITPDGQTGLNRATVWRLLTSLEQNGYVEKDISLRDD